MAQLTLLTGAAHGPHRTAVGLKGLETVGGRMYEEPALLVPQQGQLDEALIFPVWRGHSATWIYVKIRTSCTGSDRACGTVGHESHGSFGQKAKT